MTHHVSVYLNSSCSLSVLPESVQVPGTDVAHFVYDTFTIAAARTVIEQAYQAPLKDQYRVHVLVGRRFTHEAQNALLKILEDPPLTARFMLVVPSESHLLPTVRSRVAIIAPRAGASDASAAVFLSESLSARLARIQSYQKEKNAAAIRDLIRAIGQYVAAAPPTSTWCTPAVRRAVEQAVRYSSRSGASQKMLCEHLALVVPIVSTH